MLERNLTRHLSWKDTVTPLVLLLVFMGLLPLVSSHAFYRHVLTLIFRAMSPTSL
jgi:hypothetical protein